MRKYLLGLFVVALVFAVGYSIHPAVAYTDSGTCGPNVQWVLNDDGILTISGTGPMTDFQISTAPWYKYFIRDNVKRLVIEEGVTTVGTHAFEGLWYMTDVQLPSTIMEIHLHGFGQAKGLERINIPEGLLSIGEEAFIYCEKLDHVVLPSTLTEIGAGAFYRCVSLTSIEIPDQVQEIKDNTFFGCESLVFIRIGAGVTAIGDGAFIYNNKLNEHKTVWFPDNIETQIHMELDDRDRAYVRLGTKTAEQFKGTGNCFIDPDYPDYSLMYWQYNNNGIDELVAYQRLTDDLTLRIPPQVTVIGDFLFNNCDELTHITIPDGINRIGQNAFGNCVNLAYAVVPESVKVFAYNAFGKQSLVLCFGDSAAEQFCRGGGIPFLLLDTPSEKTISLPTMITEISEETLAGTSAQIYIVPGNVESIGSRAFSQLGQVSVIHIGNSVRFIADDAFEGSTVFFYCPAGSYAETYAKHKGIECVVH